jgi:succinate dehydrogenase/fumarate reductase flavoprotein subunit
MSTETTIPAELIADLQESLVLAASGIRDPETMRKAREEMNRLREELRQRIGTVDVAVDLVRDARNQ